MSLLLVIVRTILDTQYDTNANGLSKEEVEKIQERFDELQRKTMKIMIMLPYKLSYSSWTEVYSWLEEGI